VEGRVQMGYAVVETGGKQYRVEEGQVLQVEQLPQSAGEKLELDRVLLVANGEDVLIGRPLVDGARVRATVLGERKAPKRLTMKYRAKEHYRRKLGHRQTYTVLRIDEIAA
jgi:large subunit ribosomal protein L21